LLKYILFLFISFFSDVQVRLGLTPNRTWFLCNFGKLHKKTDNGSALSDVHLLRENCPLTFLVFSVPFGR